ncbi:hypothetical protein KKY_3181 [Pelagibacterium halotolerans B2]|uniref:Uncharacterized protein n=1 Tax=Pelagibacterium halotolerans (strain DSM 22347 / JCM 15775 / CGMCC 1.7692 / B2) TaxID=1082931 RepID=G4R6A5_PELHB|nr:hypothetical protein KKY_3181 [Pelagibacterium halotolerans B2]
MVRSSLVTPLLAPPFIVVIANNGGGGIVFYLYSDRQGQRQQGHAHEFRGGLTMPKPATQAHHGQIGASQMSHRNKFCDQ